MYLYSKRSEQRKVRGYIYKREDYEPAEISVQWDKEAPDCDA